MITYSLLLLLSSLCLIEGKSIIENNDTALEYLNNCKCVLKEYCLNGKLNVYGIGIISTRYDQKNRTENPTIQCSTSTHICCERYRDVEENTGKSVHRLGANEVTLVVSQKLIEINEIDTTNQIETKKTDTFVDKMCDVCGKPRPSINIRLLANPNDISAAIDGEFPWMTSVYRKNALDDKFKFKCAGTLISDCVVLTAAHCVHGAVRRPAEFKVLANGKKELHNIGDDPLQERAIDKIISHPQYYSGGAHNDIALLFLEKSYNESRILNNVCLPDGNTKYDTTKCLATGWGTKNKLQNEDQILRKVTLPIVDRKTCQESLRKTRLGGNFELHDSSICAGGVKGEDTCKGDGGGPLICPNEDEAFIQIGIVSWGVDCGGQNIPGVYTDVSKFTDWIQSSIEKYKSGIP